MKYKAYLSFYPTAQGVESSSFNKNLPIAMMMVDGGTSWRIDFHSTDDIALFTELDQARTYKNLILYLSGTKDGRDMKAALDLMQIAEMRMYISLILTIERFSGGKTLEGAAIYEENALVSFPPKKALKNTMMITLKLEEPIIFQGPVKNHHIKYIRREL